jgi:cobalt-zinc-cadmium efflux system outer membrane protein
MNKVAAVLAAAGGIAALAASANGQTRVTSPGELVAAEYVDAANGLTLDEAVRMALDREPSLRASKHDVDAARGGRVQAALRPNPSLSLGRQDEPAGSDNQTRVEVQWPLDLFRRRGRVAVADRQVAVAESALVDRQRVLAAAVRAKYGEVAAMAREVAVTDALLAVTAGQHDLIAARAEQGAAPPIERDVLRIELQRLQAERALQAGRAAQGLVELARLVGQPPTAAIKIRTTLEALSQSEGAQTAPASDPGSAGSRADVQLARARALVADARIEEARGEGRVDLSLFGMYMRMDSGFMQRGFDPGGELARIQGVFHYVAAGAMISLPLLNRNQGAIASARAERESANAMAEATELTARAEIAAALSRVEHAARGLAAYTEQTRGLARQNVDVVRQTYELGRATVFDVLAEQRRYLDFERAYTVALREAYDARQSLSFARGDIR